MPVKDSEQTSRYGPGLPNELLNAAWLVEDGITTPANRHWEFQKGGVYQIGQGVSQRALLIYCRDEGRHHVLRSYWANWVTAYTDQQLYGMEVLRLAENMKSCPYCGGKVLKVEVSKEAEDRQFFGRVFCQNKGCEAIAGWRIVLPKDDSKAANDSLTPEEKSARQEAAAREILIAAWNRRG